MENFCHESNGIVNLPESWSAEGVGDNISNSISRKCVWWIISDWLHKRETFLERAGKLARPWIITYNFWFTNLDSERCVLANGQPTATRSEQTKSPPNALNHEWHSSNEIGGKHTLVKLTICESQTRQTLEPADFILKRVGAGNIGGRLIIW